MNKKIYSEFTQAEKEWVAKIQNVFDKYFSEFEKDYQWMAELMNVIKDRVNQHLDDKDIRYLYIKLSAKITGRSHNNLNWDDFDRFCLITDNDCSQKIEI